MAITKNIKLKIVTYQYDVKMLSCESIFDTLEKIEYSVPDPASRDKNELVCEGSITFDEYKTEIKYKENPEMLSDWETTVLFYHEDNERIKIKRSGSMGHKLVFDLDERTFGTYTTPYGPLDVCILTEKVKNSIAQDGGRLFMDYLIELKGTYPRRTQMTLEYKEI